MKLSQVLLILIFTYLSQSCLFCADKNSVLSSTETLKIEDSIITTLQNNDQIKLTSQEVDVLKSKLNDAKRNIFPTLSLKAEKTNGIAEPKNGVPGFEEQSYISQINWSIFEGGRINALYKQSQLNLKVGELKISKIKQELVYNTKEAYWNTAKYIASLQNYIAASKDVKNYYDMAIKMYKNNNISNKELLGVESQYNQAVYQIETTKTDTQNQIWVLADAMGLTSLPHNYPDSKIPFEKINIDLDKCLKLCNEFNSEILTQKILVEVNKYNQKIKNSYKFPKISIQGSYGQSGGAYDSETFKLNEDYYAGIQLSQVFGLNTLSLSDIEQKTSPKVGQSSISESHTSSAQLTILDNYKQKSEKMEADLAYNQAIYNQKKAIFSAESEIRKAFTNYSKALLQVENTQLELNILKQELNITKMGLGTEKTTIADVATAINKYASGQQALTDAKVFYLISLAALEKAVGTEVLC